MLIVEHPRRFFRRKISVQPEWLEELCVESERSTGTNSASWTGMTQEYHWDPEVLEWLENHCKSWKAERCKHTGDFLFGLQARIWFARKQDAAMFKLRFGGKSCPDKFRVIQRGTITLPGGCNINATGPVGNFLPPVAK